MSDVIQILTSLIVSYYDLRFNITGYDFSFVVTAVFVHKDQHILV